MQRQVKAQMLKIRSIVNVIMATIHTQGDKPCVDTRQRQTQQLIGQVYLIIFAVQVLNKRPHNGRAKFELS